MKISRITARIRPLYEVPLEEAKNFCAWVFSLIGRTQFDMAIMNHPRMCMTSAHDENGEPILYIPIQPVLMFDALAPRPGLSKKQIAFSMWKIGEITERAMQDSGICDAYLYTNDDDEADTCAKHGWVELVGVRLLRKRIKFISKA